MGDVGLGTKLARFPDCPKRDPRATSHMIVGRANCRKGMADDLELKSSDTTRDGVGPWREKWRAAERGPTDPLAEAVKCLGEGLF